jgi:hypothetical protein
MRQRGASVIEVLVAAAIGAGVALGLTGFFLTTLRLGKDIEAQAALQRQGSAIAEELGRRARPVVGSLMIEDPANPPETPACLPLSTNDTVLVIPDASGSVTLSDGINNPETFGVTVVASRHGSPIRPDLEPINVYVKRLAGAPVATPTLKTSPVDAVTDNNMYYQGKMMIIADNPVGTPGFEIDTGLLSAPSINQPWCRLGSYLCGYAYPANHFVAMLTTGDILLGAGGTRDILGQFFAANTDLTAKFYANGGIGNTQVAGTVSAQQFDFTGAGGVPSLYQAPWNLGALPGAAGPAAGSFVSIVSSKWVQVQ